MKILAIETCFGKFSFALFEGGKLVAEFASPEENKQAEKLMPAIEEMLAANKLEYANLDAIAVAIGPGSFTGIRIGMAAAKGIAFASGIKLIGVSTLEAAAHRKGSYPVHLNASRGDAFYQESADSTPELKPHNGSFDELPTATDIGHIAHQKPNTKHLEPLYVRKPDAKLPAPARMSAIHMQCFDKGWKPHEFGDVDYIIDEDKGFIAFKTVYDECEIKTICTLPQHRKTGVAAKLLEQLISKSAGKNIFLEVEESNSAAISLYTKFGFGRFNQRKDYYGPGRNALLMRLERA